MAGMDSNHYQIMTKALNGQRAADEKTFNSLAVLNERLEHTRKFGSCFSNISFSPYVEKLAKKESSVAIC